MPQPGVVRLTRFFAWQRVRLCLLIHGRSLTLLSLVGRELSSQEGEREHFLRSCFPAGWGDQLTAAQYPPTPFSIEAAEISGQSHCGSPQRIQSYLGTSEWGPIR